MTTLRDDLLPDVDDLRGLAGELGFRPYASVVLRETTWSGTRPKDGTSTVADLALAAGGYPARVQLVSSRVVQASGGRYVDGDMRIGPLTPAFSGGGYTPAQLAASSSAPNVERHVVLVGPGEPGGGSYWTIVGTEFSEALGYSLVVRRTERTL